LSRVFIPGLMDRSPGETKILCSDCFTFLNAECCIKRTYSILKYLCYMHAEA
jgi:hypothetical protein